jgi:MFS family permease
MLGKSQPALILSYVLTVFGMAFVGVLVPLAADLSRELQVSAASLGFAITMFSVPSAVAATMFGSAVDKLGLRFGHMLGGFIIFAADLVLYFSHDEFELYAAFLISGTGFAIISAAAPALIMATSSPAAEARAMSIWASYAPAGLSFGLMLAVLSGAHGDWRFALAVHAALMLGVTILCLAVTNIASASPHSGADGWKDLVWAFTDRAVVRLAIAASIPPAIGYGTVLVMPSLLVSAYQLPLSTSSTIMALVNLTTIAGSVLAGVAMSVRVRPLLLYGVAALAGALAQILIFHPTAMLGLVIAALVIWTAAVGILMAISMAILPDILSDLTRSGAAAGLVSQAIAVGSVATPTLYFSLLSHSQSTAYSVIACVSLLLSVVVLPTRRSAATTLAPR